MKLTRYNVITFFAAQPWKSSTLRGGKKLCLDGFMYTVKSAGKSKNGMKWRCVIRVAGSCNAILQTTRDLYSATLLTTWLLKLRNTDIK